MVAGGPGDHPLTDIVNFNLKVYNKECDELIREISKLVSMNELYQMFDWFDIFSATESKLENFEVELKEKLEKLKVNAKNNGWEV